MQETRDVGSVPELGRSPGEGNGTPVFLPGESHGQRSWVGCSPWGCKESDTTEATQHVAQHWGMMKPICLNSYTNFLNLKPNIFSIVLVHLSCYNKNIITYNWVANKAVYPSQFWRPRSPSSRRQHFVTGSNRWCLPALPSHGRRKG